MSQREFIYPSAEQRRTLLREYGFENIDVSVMNISKLEKLGRGEYFKPLNPIYIISCEKGRE